MRMKKMIFSLFAIGTMFFSACNRPISTAEEWVEYSRTHTELSVIYDKLEELAPDKDKLIDIYGELSSVVGNDNTIKNYSSKDVCLAYWYIYAFVPLDFNDNRDKYTAAQTDRYARIMESQTDQIAQNNTERYIGDAKMIEILKTFATFSSSQYYQTLLGCGSPERKNNQNTLTEALFSTEKWISVCNSDNVEEIDSVFCSISPSLLQSTCEELTQMILYLREDDAQAQAKCKAFLYTHNLINLHGEMRGELRNRYAISLSCYKSIATEDYYRALTNVTYFFGFDETGEINKHFNRRLLSEYNADESQPLDGYEEIDDEPTDEDLILPYATDEKAPEY